MLSFYGVALAALGMLSNLTIGLAIDGYGPISDNAGGIAEMAELGPHVRERTDALDAYTNREKIIYFQGLETPLLLLAKDSLLDQLLWCRSLFMEVSSRDQPTQQRELHSMTHPSWIP